MLEYGALPEIFGAVMVSTAGSMLQGNYSLVPGINSILETVWVPLNLVFFVIKRIPNIICYIEDRGKQHDFISNIRPCCWPWLCVDQNSLKGHILSKRGQI